MRKRKIVITAVIGLLLIGTVTVGANGFKFEKFCGKGGKVYYIPSVKTTDSDVKQYKIADYEIPDASSVKIGDIFQSDKGYERVIGISEDGSSYLSETIFKNEIKQMRENESGKNDVSLAE